MPVDSTSTSYTGVVSLLVLGVAFAGLFLGVENWWVTFIIGYGVVVPLVGMLTGENHAEHEEAATEAGSSTTNTDATDGRTSKRDAMETLRERYAQGELSEEQFERKLERLLETETLEDARDSLERTRRDDRDDASTTDGYREVERERE